jgi:hypothetical protein
VEEYRLSEDEDEAKVVILLTDLIDIVAEYKCPRQVDRL